MDLAALDFFRPSFRWGLAVSGVTFLCLSLLSSGVVFAVMPVARYLVAAGVDRVVLDRGTCYGYCPAYRLTVQADGTASYTGSSFVRLRGTYRTHFNARAFGRLADVLYRRGLFTGRQGTVVEDAPATRLSIIFTNSKVVNSVSFGFGGDDLDDDVDAGATYIDGFAGRLCNWHRTEPPPPAAVWGWYSPISTTPCPRWTGR